MHAVHAAQRSAVHCLSFRPFPRRPFALCLVCVLRFRQGSGDKAQWAGVLVARVWIPAPCEKPAWLSRCLPPQHCVGGDKRIAEACCCQHSSSSVRDAVSRDESRVIEKDTGHPPLASRRVHLYVRAHTHMQLHTGSAHTGSLLGTLDLSGVPTSTMYPVASYSEHAFPTYIDMSLHIFTCPPVCLHLLYNRPGLSLWDCQDHVGAGLPAHPQCGS